MSYIQSVTRQIMTQRPLFFRFTPKSILLSIASIMIAFMTIAPGAYAHHPLGGRAPSTLIEGFLSGVGHPLIGLDHFAFVIAAGLLAAISRQRWMIPLSFAVAGLIGTGIHLQSLDLPAPEFFIASSVVIFGALIGFNKKINPMILFVLASIAGIFHGYAYGEAIIGAKMAPLFAYLIGFTGIQLVISFAASFVGSRALSLNKQMPEIPIRFAGFAILGIGTTFVTSALFG